MSNSEVVLTDVAKDLWHETFSFDGSNGVHIDKRTLHGGRSEGIDVVSIDNGRLRVDILPTRGMGIWRGSLDDLFLGWDSPIEQPVNPAFVELNDWNGLGWLQGFNELLCRCGMRDDRDS